MTTFITQIPPKPPRPCNSNSNNPNCPPTLDIGTPLGLGLMFMVGILFYIFKYKIQKKPKTTK